MADKDKKTKDKDKKVFNKFKTANKKNYDFLVKAGVKFQDLCLTFCQRMFSEETFPDSFKD